MLLNINLLLIIVIYYSHFRMKKKMLSQIKADTARRLEGKRPKELMSSSSLSGMSQISNSSEETLEPLAHKSDNNERYAVYFVFYIQFLFLLSNYIYHIFQHE